MQHEPFIIQPNELLQIESWKKHNVQAFFTTRKNGKSQEPYNANNLAFHVEDDANAVIENRKSLASQLKIPLEQFVFGAQNHGTRIAEVTETHLGSGIYDFESGIEQTDGLYTSLDNVVLATFYADCTPLYFTSPKHHLIGIAHSGWQGTVKGMMHTFLTHWIDDLHIQPADIFITIGPAISKAAYAVDDTVASAVRDFPHFDATPTLTKISDTHFKFDGQLLNVLMAKHLEIPEQNILTTSYCTYCDSDLFFSFRREQKTGRMLATISQTSNK
ncbi:MAG: peptidoglycan editing factor PgeF [Culicoidibacterales bacterium]